jgi:hypothetical protein
VTARLLVLVCGLSLCAGSLVASTDEADEGADHPAAGPPAAVCLEKGAASPRIDGVLDDPAWANATRITDLHQFQPVDPGLPSERSEFLVMYDEDYLYVGARLYDSDPQAIQARQLVQGGTLKFDDAIEFMLDPFGTRRTGYWFQVNPNGIRRDGLYESPILINRDWDGIWLAEARIDDLGWTVEVAIPFKTINFDPARAQWGINFARTISRKKEEIAWSSFDRAISPGTAGYADCIIGINQGRGLDIVPYAALRQSKLYDGSDSDFDLEPALDVFYKVTPSLTAALTLNTDFSATEADDRQVNLTRFSLLYPEKRQFFNQDADIFAFGEIDENGRPFFSRRIGLSEDGEPVDIIAGAKLTGRVGRWNIGMLDVLQDEYLDVGKTNIFVGRASYNVLEESSLGFIVTSGNPTSNLDNTLLGADFRYRNTNLVPGRTVQGVAWYQQSDTQGVSGKQGAYGLRLEYPNSDKWFGALNQYMIEENFNPGVGFVNRADILGRKAEVGYTFTPNGRWLRNVGVETVIENIDNTDGDLETREIILKPLIVETQTGDTLVVRVKRLREVLYEPFEIHPGVVIGVGDYEFDRFQVAIDSALERRFAVSLNLDVGEFYDGDRVQVIGALDWRPSNHLYLQFGYEFNDVDLPDGSFITRLYRSHVDIAFNSKWSWLNLLQYDNVTDTASLNSRLRYNPQAGQDVYLVINRQFDVDPRTEVLRSTESEVILQIRYTFRY